MRFAPAQAICTIADIRAIESRHAGAEPPLMERAGTGAVPQALRALTR